MQKFKNRNLRLFEALNTVAVLDRKKLQSRLPWYFERGIQIDPPFAFFLDDKEIDTCAEWFAKTTDDPFIGDSGFIAISIVSELILANQIERVVQLGHYAGFGSLILGMILAKVSPRARLISFDIDFKMTKFCDDLMERVGLEKVVQHVCIDSTDSLTLHLAGLQLAGNPGLIFIDASKQYHNTIKEVTMWSEYVNGYIVAHDTSIVAKSDQANGLLGVSDGLVDSAKFMKNELLIIDPHTELLSEFPYLDPCGLGIGLARGIKNLPNDNKHSVNNLLKFRSVLGTHKLDHSENWFLEPGFEFQPKVLLKKVGAASWATCFAPIIPGETVSFEIEIMNSNNEEIMICGGGNPGTSYSVKGNGTHRGEFVCGKENSLVGIFGSFASAFHVKYFSVYPSSM